jgi:hypothetical protein
LFRKTMNRVEFGKLVASLRREHEDEEGLPWTQARFASEANAITGVELLSEAIVGSIEQGRRGMDGETLLALAEGLRLTSGERKEFFLASCGIENEEIPRQENDPQEVVSLLIDRMKETYLPSYVMDSYYDIVAINPTLWRALFEEFSWTVDLTIDQPFPANLLYGAFREEAAHHWETAMGEDWSEFAHQHMMLFRTFTLRYRATEYFQALLQEMKQYRLFKRYWREVYLQEKGHFVEHQRVRLHSPTRGPLDCFCSSTAALTTAGDLHFYIFVPANYETSTVFSQTIQRVGTENVVRVGSWPDKVLVSHLSL